jgi:hypothetical protein
MSTFNIDYSDKTTTPEEGLDAAIVSAQTYIDQHVGTTATIYDSDDKAVALVTAAIVQTLATDPGF